jgi:hypothetical protein
MFLAVILRSKATKNLIVSVAAEILRGVHPEYAEGLKMTVGSCLMDTYQQRAYSALTERSR